MPFPNLPYLIDDGPDASGHCVRLSQHHTILRYLGRKLGLTGAAPGCSPAEAAAATDLADMATEATRDWVYAFCDLTYAPRAAYEAKRQGYVETTLPQHAKRFEALLTPAAEAEEPSEDGPRFLCGAGRASLSYADFFLFEVLEQHRLWSAEVLAPFPQLQRFATAMGALPRLAEWRAQEEGDGTAPHNRYSQFFRTEAQAQAESAAEG